MQRLMSVKFIYRCAIIFFFLFCYSSGAFSQCAQQISLQNPSFEGTPGDNVVPPSWTACNSNADIGPVYGWFLQPYEGNSYLILAYNIYTGAQGVSQQLSSPLPAGVPCSFTIELAGMLGCKVEGCGQCQIWAVTTPAIWIRCYGVREGFRVTRYGIFIL